MGRIQKEGDDTTDKDEDFAFELDDVMLESIAGGELVPDLEVIICQLIQKYKQLGLTKEQLLISLLPTPDERLYADTVAYVEEMWGSISI